MQNMPVFRTLVGAVKISAVADGQIYTDAEGFGPYVPTQQVLLAARVGDYLVINKDGVQRLMSPEEFELHYEPVIEEASGRRKKGTASDTKPADLS